MIRRLLILILIVAAPLAAKADNPFGVMLWPGPGQDFTMMAARAGALGVVWFRPPMLYADRWRADAKCAACKVLARSGLSLVLTVRAGGHDAPPHRPSALPEDLTAYGRTLAAMIEQWHPAMLVVEDEENRRDRFAGTAQDYAVELDAACKVAHAHGIQCSNGGLSYEAATGLTWFQLLNDGRADLACDYARRAFYERLGTVCAFRRADQVPADVREKLLDNGDELLTTYRQAPIDAVNFHWNGGDAAALSQTIDALSHLAGKPAMSNGISLRRSDSGPSHVRPLMRAAMAGGLRMAVWYSYDSEDSISLFDDAGRLRPAGQEFAHQMSGLK
jgi:hypothetical protein